MKDSSIARVVLAVIAGMSIGWSVSAYGADKADTARKMMKLPAKAADEKAKRDLLSILQPTDKFTKGNRIPVSGIAMDTIPYGAGFKGLCRRDELFLVYRATVKGRNSVDDPLRPVGVEAERQFHVTTGPVTGLGDPFSRQAPWNDGDCMKLQSDRAAAWFSASSNLDAARGINMFLAAVAALRSGDLKVKDCSLETDKGVTCEQGVLKIAQMDKISSVANDCSAGPSQQCYTIFLGPTVYLMIRASFDDEMGFDPTKIDSISVGKYIIVA